MTPLATAPRAHADLDDLIIQPIIDTIGQAAGAVDPGAAAALDPSTDVGSLVEPALAAAATSSDSVPLTMSDVTEPVVDISVGGGTNIPVLVDTGSDGLVVPWYDIGWQDIGFPTGIGIGSYSGGMDYLYITLPTTVNFGDGITTGQTSVDVELFAWPTTSSGDWSISSFLGGSADGILGIGPNAVGPATSNPIEALPGDLSQGVLINESAGVLQFGPNPLTADASVAGAPDATLYVSVDGGPLQQVSAIIDSGGVYGTIPSSVLPASVLAGSQADGGTVPDGTTISVYASDDPTQAPLYSYLTSGGDGPTVTTSGDTMDTGYAPFNLGPVYIGNSGAGTTTFDKP